MDSKLIFWIDKQYFEILYFSPQMKSVNTHERKKSIHCVHLGLFILIAVLSSTFRTFVCSSLTMHWWLQQRLRNTFPTPDRFPRWWSSRQLSVSLSYTLRTYRIQDVSRLIILLFWEISKYDDAFWSKICHKFDRCLLDWLRRYRFSGKSILARWLEGRTDGWICALSSKIRRSGVLNEPSLFICKKVIGISLESTGMHTILKLFKSTHIVDKNDLHLICIW